MALFMSILSNDQIHNENVWRISVLQTQSINQTEWKGWGNYNAAILIQQELLN